MPVDCPTCDGNGEVLLPDPTGFGFRDFEECDFCEGSGSIVSTEPDSPEEFEDWAEMQILRNAENGSDR